MSENNKSRKRIFIFVIALLALAVAGFFVFGSELVFNLVGREAGSQGAAWVPIEVTEDNLPDHLSSFSAVSDLPENAIVALYVGNSAYTIEKSSVRVGAATNPDLTVRIPASYLKTMGEKGWCAALQTAQINGDLGVEFHKSTASLAWQYRDLSKYRLCLG